MLFRSWQLVKALADRPTLPKPIREIAILVTGAHFHSAYELYAHILVAQARGLSDAKIRTITAGERPADLTPEEALAHDFARELVTGGLVPHLIYDEMVATFGQDGTAERPCLERGHREALVVRGHDDDRRRWHLPTKRKKNLFGEIFEGFGD